MSYYECRKGLFYLNIIYEFLLNVCKMRERVVLNCNFFYICKKKFYDRIQGCNNLNKNIMSAAVSKNLKQKKTIRKMFCSNKN